MEPLPKFYRPVKTKDFRYYPFLANIQEVQNNTRSQHGQHMYLHADMKIHDKLHWFFKCANTNEGIANINGIKVLFIVLSKQHV